MADAKSSGATTEWVCHTAPMLGGAIALGALGSLVGVVVLVIGAVVGAIVGIFVGFGLAESAELKRVSRHTGVSREELSVMRSQARLYSELKPSQRADDE